MFSLEKKMAEGDPALLTVGDRKALSAAAGRQRGGKGSLKALMAMPGWQNDQVISEAIRGPLMGLAARYLMNEKGLNKRALDPVAHFHLSNGASMESLNWKADSSPRGLGNSAGIMINYLYDLTQIEDNHEAYTSTGKINASSRMRSFLKD